MVCVFALVHCVWFYVKTDFKDYLVAKIEYQFCLLLPAHFKRAYFRVVGMPWPQTVTTHYHAQLRLLEKRHANKELVVCYLLWLLFLGWPSSSSIATPRIFIKIHSTYQLYLLLLFSPFLVKKGLILI